MGPAIQVLQQEPCTTPLLSQNGEATAAGLKWRSTYVNVDDPVHLGEMDSSTDGVAVLTEPDITSNCFM